MGDQVMTRKDYELIASAFRLSSEGERNADHVRGNHDAAITLSSLLQQQNPRFDRTKFLRACGLNIA